MYAKHFGLMRRPFAVTGDAAICYPATSHELAYRQLLHAIRHEENFLVVSGAAGLGKTMLAHRLLSQLDGEWATLWLTHTHFPDVTAMLQAMLYDLGQSYQEQSEQELRLRLMDRLLSTYQEGQRTLLVIDEAQHLRMEHLEELRLLGNLETREGQVLQILLLGQPALLEKLRRAEMAALAQRITTSVKLEPLDVHEAADYLVHHLRAAGARVDEMITDEALELLARGTGGVPRLLNQATHLALHFAHEAGQTPVDAEAAIEALRELNLPMPAEDGPFLAVGVHEETEMEEAA